jgi:F-type H+-transporting ATPase subunit b
VLNFGVTFFITILNLFILYLILRRLLFKPVTAFMEKRANKVRSDLADAAMMKGKAEEAAKRYDGLLAEADIEAERLVKEGDERAKEEAKRILTAAQAEAAQLRARGEEAAVREAEKAMQALVSEIAGVATAIAARLAAREPAVEDARAAEVIIREMEAGRAG